MSVVRLKLPISSVPRPYCHESWLKWLTMLWFGAGLEFQACAEAKPATVIEPESHEEAYPADDFNDFTDGIAIWNRSPPVTRIRDTRRARTGDGRGQSAGAGAVKCVRGPRCARTLGWR